MEQYWKIIGGLTMYYTFDQVKVWQMPLKRKLGLFGCFIYAFISPFGWVFENLVNSLYYTLRFVVRTLVKLDRFVVKRYLGIETPLYKLWWANHSEAIQRKLDKIKRN